MSEAAAVGTLDDDVTQIVPIHDRSPVEFEWIGLNHALEGPGITTRGANSTSVDVFMVARTQAGRRAYLMEWKYVEEYSPKDLGEGSRGETRRRRYARLYTESPAFNGKTPFEAWLFELLRGAMASSATRTMNISEPNIVRPCSAPGRPRGAGPRRPPHAGPRSGSGSPATVCRQSA